MLENIISEVGIKGHNEYLLQQLIKGYLDIYLAKDYHKLGVFIDEFLISYEICIVVFLVK